MGGVENRAEIPRVLTQIPNTSGFNEKKKSRNSVSTTISPLLHPETSTASFSLRHPRLHALSPQPPSAEAGCAPMFPSVRDTKKYSRPLSLGFAFCPSSRPQPTGVWKQMTLLLTDLGRSTGACHCVPCLRHSPPYVSSCRPPSISHHRSEKGEDSTVRYFERFT